MKNNLALPIAILIAGIIVGGAIFYNKKSSEPKNNRQTEQKQQQKLKLPSPITKNDHVLGNPDAQLSMIEFSDTECPFCKRFQKTMKQVVDNYGKEGKVKWVYRHFPLDTLHSKSRKEAEATECAAELGGNEKFWQYLDRIYEITPSNNGLDPKQLPKIAEYLKINKTDFEKCLASGKYAKKVEDNYQDGIRSGVRGTPHTVIIAKDGKNISINGAFPYMETTPRLFYNPNFKEKENFCSKETKLCGVKIAIDKLLKE
ncbi:MAG TPA: hypothetical protein ENG99_00435 [bacterium]|nr:hypothetical protein [bacterium]